MITDNHLEEILTRCAKIWLRKDGIVQVFVKPGAVYTLVDIREDVDYIVKLSKGQRRSMLIDARNLRSLDLASRKEAASLENIISMAILIGSPVSRMIGNVFISIYKTPFPSKLFNSEADAVEWLKEFLE